MPALHDETFDNVDILFPLGFIFIERMIFSSVCLSFKLLLPKSHLALNQNVCLLQLRGNVNYCRGAVEQEDKAGDYEDETDTPPPLLHNILVRQSRV